MKCLLSVGFALGGIYEFAVVKVDAPKEANRDAFEMPENRFSSDEDPYSNGLRRRRTMREVDSIVSTQDGSQVLVRVLDGGVLHYQGGISERLQEVPSLSQQREADNSQLVW